MFTKKVFYISLPLIILVLLAYFPPLSVYFELKFAPYTGAVYAVQLEDNSFVYGKVAGSSLSWLKIKNVYYFQSIEVNGETTKNLVPQASNVLTEPSNFLLLNKSKIVSIEKVGQKSKLLDIMMQNEK